jgi:hypothetical protein
MPLQSAQCGAVALCCVEIQDSFDGAGSDNYKVETNLNYGRRDHRDD